MRTPWGIADEPIDVLADGVLSVTTPSHGGVLVRTDVAEAMLTYAARAIATDSRFHQNVRHGGKTYLAYEEDCEVAVLLFERPEWFPEFSQFNPGTPRDYGRRVLARYFPAYPLPVEA